ncbi:gamma-glutamyltransferase family protein [Nakamurella lactea]|uniref:gamma-glutamyltransferase family protein n=1 Tax=Nakamurella lactea TaxID=459515 RepID=UPI0004901364|nr:gamma-glutamyltransferase [Nakamurella lactea]
MSRSERVVGKTAAKGQRGMVASHNPQAAEAGAQVLADGGSAVDAITTMSFLTGVREVAMNSVGGVGVLLHHCASTGTTEEISFYGRTPAALAEDTFVPYLLPRESGSAAFGWRPVRDDVHERGPLSVGVPGHVAGISALHTRHGSAPWADLLAPAERLARSGFDPDGEDTFHFGSEFNHVQRYDEMRRVFLSGGIPRPAGFYQGRTIPVVQPDLSDSIAAVAAGGADEFYNGELAARIAAGVQAEGGLLSADDLARFRPDFGDGLRGSYRGYRVISSSGPNGGVTLLEMLNLAENFDLAALPRFSGQCLHLLAEIMRQAWTDRFVHVGDPDRTPVPLTGLIDKRYASDLATELPKEHRGAWTTPGDPWTFDPARRPADRSVPAGDLAGKDTTHLLAADADGNVVSLTQTLGLAFGSCFIPRGTGLNLYDVTMWMNPEPGTPNSVAPWVKQVGHATPTLLLKDGKVVAALGAPGGRRVVTAMFQTVINIVDFGMDVAEAIAAPRLHCEGAAPSAPVGPTVADVLVDDRVPAEALADLTRRGHLVRQCRETETQSFLAKPLGVQYTDDGLIGGADVFRRSLAIGV